MVNYKLDAIYELRKYVWDELKNHFRPEFLNRIDETVVFHSLDAAHIAKIAAIQLKVLTDRLSRMDLGMDVSAGALEELAKVKADQPEALTATSYRDFVKYFGCEFFEEQLKTLKLI